MDMWSFLLPTAADGAIAQRDLRTPLQPVAQSGPTPPPRPGRGRPSRRQLSFRGRRLGVALAWSLGPAGWGAETIQFEYSQYRVGEASGLVSLAVLRGPDAAQAATVDFTVSGNTATPGVDYTETQGTLPFAPSERLKLITIPILNDAIKEPAETLQVRLSNPTGSSLGPRTAATVTLVDNDQGLQFSTRQVWAHEDLEAVELKVLRGSDGADPISVDYTFADLTAKSGEDYFAANGTLQFAAGERDKTLRVMLAQDDRLEGEERFQVLLANASPGAGMGTPASVTVTVVDGTGMEPSRFGHLERPSDGSVRLALAHSSSSRFLNYWRLSQVEVSEDLQAWSPLPLIGTPAVSNRFTVELAQRGVFGRKFARLIRSPLFSPDPPPTGPYPVGVTRRDLGDPSRRNRYGISTNGGFPVSIWYPAVPVAGRLPSSLLEAELLTVEAAGPASLMDRLPRFASYATADLPLASPAGAGWPVVLFSHGADGFRAQGQAICQNLASHGFVVVAPDHYDSFAVLLPSGQVYLSPTTASYTVANSQDRVKDLKVTLDEIQRMNEGDGLLRAGLDLNRVGAVGFSWGAPTAAEFGRTDSRCRAVVSLEWGVATTSGFPELVQEGIPQPSLMVNAADNASDYLYSKASRDAVWVQISNTTHGDLILAPWFSGGITPAAIETARTVQAYLASFFQKYLHDDDDHLLDGPSAAYPKVSQFRKK